MWCLSVKCLFVNGLYIQTSLAVNCLPAASDRYYHTYAQKWWSGKLKKKKKKKKKFFFFFVVVGIFTSGRFCLTHGSAGVGLHFREAPGWSGRVHMYDILFSKIVKSVMNFPKHTCTEIYGAFQQTWFWLKCRFIGLWLHMPVERLSPKVGSIPAFHPVQQNINSLLKYFPYVCLYAFVCTRVWSSDGVHCHQRIWLRASQHMHISSFSGGGSKKWGMKY